MKRILKWLGWLVGGAVALVVVAYLALLAINWRDRPPSEAARRLQAIYRDRPAVADADNGFVFVMSFAPGYKSPRSPAAQKIADACKAPSWIECSRALEGSEQTLREWIQSEQWLLDRYVTLLHRSGWVETVPTSASAPLPAYATVLDGQKILFAKAYLRATDKDAAGVRELLGDDVRFWRRVLASSDILITKMIAVAALHRHFAIGNLILRRLPPDLELQAQPSEWSTTLSDVERSMLRTFTGEWVFGDHLMREALQSASVAASASSESEPGLIDRLTSRAFAPLFQVQDTNNLRADMFIRGAETMNVPVEEIPEATKRARKIFDQPDGAHEPFTTLYNPLGRMSVWVGASGFAGYGARVTDVEGSRRAAVLTTSLRSHKLPIEQIPAALAASDLRAPYTGKPFEWDADEQAIVFTDFAPSDRARHAFVY
jgi:hypothetical protein